VDLPLRVGAGSFQVGQPRLIDIGMVAAAAAGELCPRAAVLHHGRLAFDGPIDAAWERYRELERGPLPGPVFQA
jgi:hypothetical protein